MNVAAILFDLWGTLDNDGVSWRQRYWELCDAGGLAVGRSDFDAAYAEAKRLLGQEAPPCSMRLTPRIGCELEALFRCLEYRVPGLRVGAHRHRTIRDRAVLDVIRNATRLRPFLRELSRKWRVSVVCNSNGNLAEVLSELRLDGVMHLAVDGCTTGHSWDDPGRFLMAAERLGVNADRCVAVGESHGGHIAPAQQAGCRTVWLSRAEPSEGADRIADAVIESVFALPDVLAGGAGG